MADVYLTLFMFALMRLSSIWNWLLLPSFWLENDDDNDNDNDDDDGSITNKQTNKQTNETKLINFNWTNQLANVSIRIGIAQIWEVCVVCVHHLSLSLSKLQENTLSALIVALKELECMLNIYNLVYN